MRRLCLLWLFFALPARADVTADLAQASRLLGELQEEAAVQVITRALDRGDASAAETAQLYALLGMARFNLQDDEGARLAFRRALDAKDDAALPARASPKTRAFFEQVRAHWRQERALALARRPPSPPPVKEPDVSGQAPLGPLRTAGVVGATAGALALATGGALTLIARQERELAQNAEADALAAQERFAAADSMHRWGTGLLFAGGGLALAGAALALFGPSDAPVQLSAGPTQLTATVHF